MPGRVISPALRFGQHDLTLALLAFASGATDVLAFLALGGVFTSAMTGWIATATMAATVVAMAWSWLE